MDLLATLTLLDPVSKREFQVPLRIAADEPDPLAVAVSAAQESHPQCELRHIEFSLAREHREPTWTAAL
jgi:hypothetical protein